MNAQSMHGVMLFTAVFGFLGQLAKSHPNVKNWIPTTAMIVAGVLFYAGNNGWPHAEANTFQSWFAAVSDWLEAAALAAAAIPGTASVFGLIPAMKTRELPKP